MIFSLRLSNSIIKILIEKVKLSNFAIIQGLAKVRVNMVVQLSSVDGTGSKTYAETDVSGWSAGRAFGSVIYHTI